jgi:FMN phosphatase YigB (HAD superfamily)
MKTILIDAVDCFVIEKEENNFIIFQDMYDLLEKYSNKKIILTGADDEKFKVFKLDKMPYEVFTLKHNPEKTNPEYYKIFLNKYGLRKDDVIYFEHNKDVVKSAQSIGINTYFYDNDKKDLESLKKFLEENLK